MPRDIDIDRITKHYLIAALWSSVGEDGASLDEEYGLDDIAAETKAKSRKDVADFVDACGEALCALSDAQVGLDFWLTRNGHGAGFWDRGLGGLGEYLTSMCRPYGIVDLYLGDDGQIHCS